MSGETELHVSGWTVDTLRELMLNIREESVHSRAEMDLRYQQRFDASQQALTAALTAADRAVQSALNAAEKAVVKAENAAERRFDSVNEFRATLSDQAAGFLTRVEADARFESVADKLTSINETLAKSSGKSGAYGAMGAAGLAMLALLVALFGVFYRPGVDAAAVEQQTFAIVKQLQLNNDAMRNSKQ